MVKNENLPPCKWLTGRIMELHLEKDGHTLVVSIKTPYEILRKPITWLCLLPLPKDNKNDFKMNN